MYRAVCLLWLLSFSHLQSQEGLSREDLYLMLASSPPDSIRIDIYNELAWPVYSSSYPDSSIYYAQKSIELAQKIRDQRRLSIAHRRLGITFINIDETKKAIHEQEKSYRICENIGDKKGMMLALNNIGVAYLNNELLNTALNYFLQSLKIIEETKDYSAASNLYTNCGMIYRRTGDLEKSKEFFLKAGYHAATQKNPEMQIVANSNLSTAYRLLNKIDSAAIYLDFAGRHLHNKISDNTQFRYYLTRALLLSAQGHHEAALKDFIAMQPLVTVLNDRITLLINIAEEYHKLENSKKSQEYFQRAFSLSLENKLYNNLEYVCLSLANIHEQQGDLKNFSKYIRNHLAYKDSNERLNKAQLIHRQQLQFDFRKQRLADSIAFSQKEKLSQLELEAAEIKLLKARHTRVLLVIILIILASVALFVFNRFMVTRRQKMIIESQKMLVESKNAEIFDSINYAQRLQSAILPQLSEMQRCLNIDVLFMPRDIIGGDFYFFERHKNRLFFAVCDCTGHGIPGALMSVVCYEALEKAIRSFRLREPADILNKAREIIIENLNASEQNIKDGMDCSLLVIDQLGGSIQWAGANNGLWIVHERKLTELKADKQPVAFYENSTPFTNHVLQLKPGSTLYLYTDGYADQFGGPGAKKYKTKALKNFISGIYDKPLSEQVQLLRSNFLEWKKDLDQVDDVSIGILKVS